LLVELATCRRLRGEPRAAARLLGAAEGLLERIGAALPPLERPERDRTIAFVSARLKDDERETAWMSGRSAPLAASVAAALAGWDSDGSEPPTDPVQPVGSPGQLDPVLTLRSLGRETVQLGERTLGPADFSYAKPRELLFYLADVGSANKSQIGLALWPDASPSELRSAFHTTLHHLRKAVGADRVVFQQGSYRVQRDRLDYDVDAFTQALSEARLASSRAEELRRLQFATQLYGGDYLASTAPGWSEHTRDELRDRYQRALMAMGRLFLSGGGPVGAIDAFRRVVESDPVSEAAHRGLMRCFEATGEPSRAIRQYDQLVRLLRDELGTAPAESTRALYDRIRSQLEVRSG
jgi:DNA-binding SARP family transcriptional activator